MSCSMPRFSIRLAGGRVVPGTAPSQAREVGPATQQAVGWPLPGTTHFLPEWSKPSRLQILRQFLKLSLTAGHEHVRAPAALPGVECDPHRLDAIERCVICDSGIPLIAVVEQLMLVDPE